MPEPTQVEIEFIIKDAQAKGELAELEARGQRVKEILEKAGVKDVGAAVGEFSNVRDQAAYQAYVAKTGEAKENVKETSGFLDRVEGQFGRIVTRLIAFSAISAAIKVAWEGIKDLLNVEEAEASWHNLVDDTEQGVQSFNDLKEAMHATNTGLDQGVSGVRELVAAGETVSQATAEVTKLAEAAKVAGVPLKGLTTEIANIRESGTITFGELVKLNEQFGGILQDQVNQWRQDERALKDYTEAVRVADKAQQELTTTSEKSLTAQESLADKVGLTKKIYEGLQASIAQQHPEYARQDAGLVAEQQNRLLQSQMASNVATQMSAGMTAMAQQTGLSEADVQRYVAGGQITAKDLTTAAREQRAEQERLRTEGERETIAKMKQEQTERQKAVAAAVPGRIEAMPGLTEKFNAAMSTVGASFQQVGEQAKRTAEAFKDAIDVITGRKPVGYVAPAVPVAPGLRPSAAMFGVSGANIGGMEQARLGAGAGAAAIAGNPTIEKNTGDTNTKLDMLLTILSAALSGGAP
jgi:hypothetical protein